MAAQQSGALDRHSAAAFGLAPCRQVTLVVIRIEFQILRMKPGGGFEQPREVFHRLDQVHEVQGQFERL